MDGIHDLAGVRGFGAVEVESDEPVFHEPWQSQAFMLLNFGIAGLRAYNPDEYRHAIERMDPVHYLSAHYYERVLTGVATLLVERGLVTRDELDERAGGAFPLSRPVAAAPVIETAPQPTARFAAGDAVVVRCLSPAGHTRAPRYVRGRQGVILHVAPRFPHPDSAAHGIRDRREHTYHVAFRARDLWGDGADGDEVVVDLWDSYLQAAG